MPRCLNCKQKFTPSRFLQKFCNDEKCVDASIQYARAKVNEKRTKEWQKEKKTLKNDLKTLTQLEAEAKKSFQKFIRLRDEGLPCISCGNSTTKDWAGGHYFPAGIYSGLMFDERNCHKQCNTHCNKYLSGNLLEYRKGLIVRYGLDFVNELESESDAKRDFKYTREQLIAKKLQYDLKIKMLKN
jgi:hypothetical protein